MSRSFVMLVAIASAGVAQPGGGQCGFAGGGGHCWSRDADPRGMPWIETLLRWEEMFPPMRGFGFLLAGLDLSREQSRGIAGIVEAADDEIRELERDMVPEDPRRGFFESFVSVDFEPIDLELAVDRTAEFHDGALLVVSSAVDGIRDLLTDEQLSAASDLVDGIGEFGPEPGHGWREGMRPGF